MLSSIAHARPCALGELIFEMTEHEQKELITEENEALQNKALHFKRCSSPEAMQYICKTAINAYATPLIRKCKLFGWDMSKLKQIFDEVHVKI